MSIDQQPPVQTNGTAHYCLEKQIQIIISLFNYFFWISLQKLLDRLFLQYCSVMPAIKIELLSPTIIALKTSNDDIHHLNSRRNGGILASAAKLFLVVVPLRTRLVFEIVAQQ